MEDLEAFLSPEQAVEAFAMLDNNGDGKLVLADIRDAVIKIYKERRNLALSLKVHSCAFAATYLEHVSISLASDAAAMSRGWLLRVLAAFRVKIAAALLTNRAASCTCCDVVTSSSMCVGNPEGACCMHNSSTY